MGNMYRVLKGKVEGSSLKDKLTRGSKTQVGGSAGGQKGMADALAEMTKRSSFHNPKLQMQPGPLVVVIVLTRQKGLVSFLPLISFLFS